MIESILLHHQTREWLDFWIGIEMEGFDIYFDCDTAWIWKGDKLIAEFLPNNSPQFIFEILEELKKE